MWEIYRLIHFFTTFTAPNVTEKPSHMLYILAWET
jgi:hypothetical protein